MVEVCSCGNQVLFPSNFVHLFFIPLLVLDKALVSSLSQFITDGVLSVAVFIGNFLMRLVEYPDEQEKIYQEILDVVGQERLPTLEDKSKLPYTNAFIYEVTRLSDFFPMFPSLECTSKCCFLIFFYIHFKIVVLLTLYIVTIVI